MIFNVELSVNITPYSPYTINVKDIMQKKTNKEKEHIVKERNAKTVHTQTT